MCGRPASPPAPPPAAAVRDGEIARGVGPGQHQNPWPRVNWQARWWFLHQIPTLKPSALLLQVAGKAAQSRAAACEELGPGPLLPACSNPAHQPAPARARRRHVPCSETPAVLTHSLHTARTPPAQLPPGGCQTAPGRPRKTPSSPQPRTQAERERARTHTCSRARRRALLIHAQMLPAPAAQRQQLGGGRVSRWSRAASGGTAAVSTAGGARSTHACSASLHAGRQRGRGPARDQGLRQLPAAGQGGHPGPRAPGHLPCSAGTGRVPCRAGGLPRGCSPAPCSHLPVPVPHASPASSGPTTCTSPLFV